MLDADMNVEMWRVSSKFFARLRILSRVVATLLGTPAIASLLGVFSAAHPKVWNVTFIIGLVIGVASENFLPNSVQIKHMEALVPQWKKLCVEFELLNAHDEELRDTDNWNQFKRLQGRTVKVQSKENGLPYFYPLHWWAIRRVLKKRGLNYE